MAGMGDEREQGSLEDTVRRAREEMHAATESLRALLQDLRGGGRPAAYRRSKPRKRSQSVTAAS